MDVLDDRPSGHQGVVVGVVDVRGAVQAAGVRLERRRQLNLGPK